MSILTDLRAALAAKEEAASALDMLSKPGTSGFDEVSWKRAYYRLKHLEDELHAILTDDTIAALIAVAEAAIDYLQDTCGECATRFCEDDSDIGCSLDDMRDALAPLVKEADHDRA